MRRYIWEDVAPDSDPRLLPNCHINRDFKDTSWRRVLIRALSYNTSYDIGKDVKEINKVDLDMAIAQWELLKNYIVLLKQMNWQHAEAEISEEDITNHIEVMNAKMPYAKIT